MTMTIYIIPIQVPLQKFSQRTPLALYILITSESWYINIHKTMLSYLKYLFF